MINLINNIVKFDELKNGNGYKAPFVTVITHILKVNPNQIISRIWTY